MKKIQQTSSIYSKDLQVKLLSNRKEILGFTLLLIVILATSLSVLYNNYLQFSEFSSRIDEVRVLNQYQKNGKTVFKLQDSDGYTFYSSTENRYKDLKGFSVEAKISIRDELTFLDYLKGGYHSTDFLRVSGDREYRFTLLKKVISEHSDQQIGELYGAIFLSTPISFGLREDLSRLGVSHLAVLSGFHIGVITAVLFFILRLIYSPIHNRYFPYRNGYRDIVAVTVIAIVSYLLFIDTPPSFLRAVAMFLIGAFLYDRNIIKANFETLLYASLLLLALFPKLLFSVGFWFSVSGVYYIFLYLKIFGNQKWYYQVAGVNIWVFFAMIPVTHSIFGDFYTTQLLSPIWTASFIAVYILMMVSYFSPFPELIDPVLRAFLNIESGEGSSFTLSTPLLIAYISVSLLLLKVKPIR
jgi:competence protein ComEC